MTRTPPSNAASAKTEYVVTFSTSSTGGLSNAAGSQIILTFPTGTDITNLVGTAVRVSGSQTVIGNCGAPSGQILKCGLFGGNSIFPYTAVTATDIYPLSLHDALPILTVSTTSDTQATSGP